jgi:hypothetical protein
MEEQGTEQLLHENKEEQGMVTITSFFMEEQGTEQCTLIDFHP